MALKQVVLTKKITDLRSRLAQLETDAEALKERRAAMEAREAELEAAVNEVNEETSADDKAALDAETEQFDKDSEALADEEAGNAEQRQELQTQIDELSEELEQLNERMREKPVPAENKKRSEKTMNATRFYGLSAEQTRDFFGDEGVKSFLSEIRSAISEKRALNNAGLLIPDNMLGLVREEVARQSKLLPFVNHRRVTGTGRMNIMARIPEAIWTEMCARINEIDLTFNQAEVDGFKVSAAVVVCNAILEDSDIALASEIISAISTAIAKALDKAILFGTGTKTPIGIATRLAASSQPAWWGTNEPAFTDLHTTHVRQINQGSATGAAFFQALIAELGLAKPKYSGEGLFWVMNRKTHMDIMAKALAFNSAAALVSNTNLFPVVGGTVVEFEDEELADYEIIGGFGGNYLLVERAGVQLASSKDYKFMEDQTVFKGTARYDGRPLCGEAFVIVNYANSAPTTAQTFAPDYAGDGLNDLTLVAAVGASSGKTVITATGTVAQSNPVLKYKLGVVNLTAGQKLPAGFDDLTSGTTAITAAAGKMITVAEVDAAGKVISAGTVASVPHS